MTVAEVVAARLIDEAFEGDDMMQLLVERTWDSVLGKELSRLMPLDRCALADMIDERKSTIAEIIAIRIILDGLEEGRGSHASARRTHWWQSYSTLSAQLRRASR